MSECVLTQSRTCQELRLVRDRHKIPAIMSADPVWRKTSWAALEVGQAFRRGPWHTHDDALHVYLSSHTHREIQGETETCYSCRFCPQSRLAGAWLPTHSQRTRKAAGGRLKTVVISKHLSCDVELNPNPPGQREKSARTRCHSKALGVAITCRFVKNSISPATKPPDGGWSLGRR